MSRIYVSTKLNFNRYQCFTELNNSSRSVNPSKLCGNLEDLYYVQLKNEKKSFQPQMKCSETDNSYFDQNLSSRHDVKEHSANVKLYDRLMYLETERTFLDKQRSSSGVQRNLVYPIAMLLLLLLTTITVMLVVQNTIELLIGIKALPLSSRVSFFNFPSCVHLINILFCSNSHWEFHLFLNWGRSELLLKVNYLD